MQNMADIKHNFMSSHLRSQLYRLRGILDNVEKE
jgi:hypothetical protein